VETDESVYADRRNFYKVEKWSRDWLRVEATTSTKRAASSNAPFSTGRGSG
jgi:hypothetical protein